MSVLHWIAHILAFDSTTDDAYAANSGSLSYILPVIFDLTGLYLIYRWHHQCDIGGWRHLARGKFEADGHKLCARHAGKHKHLTLEHLAHFHRTGSMPAVIPSKPPHDNQGVSQ